MNGETELGHGVLLLSLDGFLQFLGHLDFPFPVEAVLMRLRQLLGQSILVCLQSPNLVLQLNRLQLRILENVDDFILEEEILLLHGLLLLLPFEEFGIEQIDFHLGILD